MAKNANNDVYKSFGTSGLDFLFNEKGFDDAAMEEGLPAVPVEKPKEEKKLISELIPFHGHPFHVDTEDEEFKDLVKSIKENGIIYPILVRPYEDKYEIIAGHCRVKAAELAGLEEVPVICKTLNDYEATLIMVHTNISGRSGISISEKAKAYRMCMDAEKHQGKAGIDTAAVVGAGQDSKRQVYRYVRLSYLVDELLALVDEKKLPVITATELAYLDAESQNAVLQFIQKFKCPSPDQAAQLRNIYESEQTSLPFGRIVAELMEAPKVKPVTKVSFKTKDLASYFAEGTGADEMESVIIMLLSKYHNGDFDAMLHGNE